MNERDFSKKQAADLLGTTRKPRKPKASKTPPPAPRGRPTVEAGEKRELIAMRLAPDELAAIRAAAARAGRPYTVWMRELCMSAAGAGR